jgi:predicted 3-demethylubiquinone-9 3-methyltransferase (glyoxalase superfamily)
MRTVEFTVMGIPCLGLKVGPAFKHNEAFSFQVATADQAETDRTGTRLSATAAKRVRAGARTNGDCPGRSTPIALTKAVTDPDTAAAKRAFDAMMEMKKIDIAAIKAARRG